MALLTEAQLSRMRSLSESALDKTCTIVRLISVSDGMGGTDTTETTLSTNVPCAIAPRGGGNEDDEDSIIRGRAAYVLTLPHDQDITSTDRVVVEERTFEVMNVHLRTYQVSQRVELAEVT